MKIKYTELTAWTTNSVIVIANNGFRNLKLRQQYATAAIAAKISAVVFYTYGLISHTVPKKPHAS